jgi:methyltransferase (TIGR00027 family)
MGDATISRSAQGVLLIRAELTSLGVIDDPYARQMLPANGRRVLRAFAWPGMWRVARLSTTPSLAVRTVFFDGFVRDAIAAGIRQVVVLAAGYDSRAWRLAQPGVAFFEVDRAATQADKRGRAPAGGPVFVAADVTDERLDEIPAYLAATGWTVTEQVTPADLAPATLAGTRLAGVVVDNPSNLVVAERTTA